jgi:hypothetical protein
MSRSKGCVVALVSAVLVSGVIQTAFAADDVPPSNAYFNTPEWLGQKYVGSESWQELDALVEKLAASGERNEDGRFQLYMMTAAIDRWLELWDEDQDENFRRKFEEYQSQFPKSAFALTLAAMQIHATAWRARGRGFSSTVTPEGRTLFHERSAQAWRMLQSSKPRGARLPTWYEQAINIGMDAGVPDADLMGLFEEGIRQFPGYYSIYFSITRQFSPRWGGSYAGADAFIRKQVAAKTNPDGEVLYARLYWLIDQYNGGSPDFFAESLVDWRRLRAGFELMMKQYPNSSWNQANFAAFACRAEDGTTYFKWRRNVDAGKFKEAAPDGISLEVCDARFTRKT